MYFSILLAFSLHSYTFQCKSWLSSNKADCETYRYLQPLDDDAKRSFDFLFPAHVKQSLFDSHVWFSVARRPNQSSYTRVQRLSTCLALLFLSMVTSAMWFGTEPENNPGLQIGPVWISFHTLYVSVMASVIIVPPTIVNMEIFRRAKRRKKPIPETPETPLEPEKPISVRNINFGSEGYTKKHKEIWSVEEDIQQLTALMEARVHMTSSPPDGDVISRRRCEMRLPWYWVFVGYFLVVASVFLGGFFCVFYSLDWGPEKSHQWLLSIVLASSQNIILLQPIKVNVATPYY